VKERGGEIDLGLEGVREISPLDIFFPRFKVKPTDFH